MSGRTASTFDIGAPPARSSRQRMGSGGGVLIIALAQLCIGVVLLGLFEGYKVYRIRYFDDLMDQAIAAHAAAAKDGKAPDPRIPDPAVLQAQAAINIQSPMGVVWWLAIASNLFSVCGVAGVVHAQRDLVVAFFAWSALQMVGGAHFFVDMLVDTGVRFGGEPPGLTSYEKATAFFLLLQVLLAFCATALAMRALDEIKTKQREEYGRLATLGDTLQFEPDRI